MTDLQIDLQIEMLKSSYRAKIETLKEEIEELKLLLESIVYDYENIIYFNDIDISIATAKRIIAKEKEKC